MKIIQNFPKHQFSKKVLIYKNISNNILKAQYAVRGTIVIRALEIMNKLKQDPNSYNFKKVIMCNIGNPQELGQKPMTFPRQILAGCFYPDLLRQGLFPNDVILRCEEILENTKNQNIGAYTHSQGLFSCRKKISKFIELRDNVKVNPKNIFL